MRVRQPSDFSQILTDAVQDPFPSQMSNANTLNAAKLHSRLARGGLIPVTFRHDWVESTHEG